MSVCIRDAGEILEHSLHDSPIMCKEQDLLGRDEFVDRLYQEITCIPYKDSIVYGLYGGWGEGKTSVLNLLQSKFLENDNFLVVYFDPWKYDNREAMLTAFYKKVEQIINEKYILEAFQSLLFKYQDVIKSGISKTGFNINFYMEEPTLEDIKKRIEAFLDRINKKLLFIFDDIDRMQADEVLLMLKFVHVNLNFHYTVYILSFDYLKVSEMIKNVSDIGEDYFEKIIQKPICIPDADEDLFDEFFGKNLDMIFNNLEIEGKAKKELAENFAVIYNSHIHKLLANLRTVKRYLNSVSLSLPMIKNEVNISDFLLLEIVKVFFPKVYEDISRNSWCYTIPDWSSNYAKVFRFSSFLSDDKSEQNKIIRVHIDNIINNEHNSEVVLAILKELFPVKIGSVFHKPSFGRYEDKNRLRLEKRIQHPDCFKKYFLLAVQKSDIPDEIIEFQISQINTLAEKKSYQEIENLLNDYKNNNELLKLLKKFKVFVEKISETSAKNIVKYICGNSDKLEIVEDRDFFSDDEFSYSKYFVLFLMNSKFDEDEIFN